MGEVIGLTRFAVAERGGGWAVVDRRRPDTISDVVTTYKTFRGAMQRAERLNAEEIERIRERRS